MIKLMQFLKTYPWIMRIATAILLMGAGLLEGTSLVISLCGVWSLWYLFFYLVTDPTWKK